MAGNLTAMMASIFSGGATPDPYFEYTTLLLPGNGTNGAQNNTFLDGSTNNFTITRNGNTTQGTFSPFSQTGWSNYFDGSANGSLRADSSTDTNLSGDFTIQAWVYPTANSQANATEIISRGAATTLNGWHFGIVENTTRPFIAFNYAGTGASTYTASTTNIPLNQWTHLAVTRSGNTCRIYINGVVDTTNTGFTATPTVSGTEYVYVGRASYDTNSRQFTGYINNASIIKGTALTTFSQTQPLATGTSGQALLTCTANRFIDTNTATTAKTLTAGSGASVVAFSPFNPTASWSAATYGGSGYFDGSGDYLSAASNTAFNCGTGNFTLEAWVYITTRTLNYPLIMGNNNGGFTTGAIAFTNSNSDLASYYDKFILAVNDYGGTRLPLIASSTNDKNTWYHVAIVRDSSTTLKMYRNGLQVASQTISSGLTFDWGKSGLLVGGGNWDGANSYFNGYMQGLRLVKGTAVYTGAFTPPIAPLSTSGAASASAYSSTTNVNTSFASSETSLLLNFTNAGIYDATSKNDLETVGNAQVSTAQYKFPPSSMYFDGAADYLLPNGSATNMFTFGTGDFTVEFWMNAISFTTPTIIIFDCRPLSTDGVYPTIYFSSGQIRYFVNNLDRITGSTLSTSQWYHIALSRSGTNTKLFVDGAQVGSTYTDSNNYLCGANRPSIGCRGFTLGDNNYYGYMQDLRVTKGYARYTSNFTPPTAAFPTL